MTTPPISLNTQAILLLTAPLILAVRKASNPPVNPLTPAREYVPLARRLGEIGREPADLLGAEAASVLDECLDSLGPRLERGRVEALLGRGVQLGLVAERWQSRVIWVVSPADHAYPRRLLRRLGAKAPPVLYGCGDRSFLDGGGLAVVGPRNAPATLLDYAAAVGREAARSRWTIVSGGARGVDQAAMAGALEAGGRSIGVLACELALASTNRSQRERLMDGRLLFVSPYDPGARFHAGRAMGRNALIYALADASLVVDALVGRGGTWAGAVEELERRPRGRVYVRPPGEFDEGLAALKDRGALPWPELDDAESFECALGPSWLEGEELAATTAAEVCEGGASAESRSDRCPPSGQIGLPFACTESATDSG